MPQPASARAEENVRTGPATRLECRICWYVYDPEVGDPVWQIAPGTPFSDLPAHWSCPNCAAERAQFMVRDTSSSPFKGEVGRGMGTSADPIPTLTLRLKEREQTGDCVASLEAAFRAIHAQRMQGLPFVNDALHVEAVGFRRWEGRWLGVLITPWFMNLVLLPDATERWTPLPIRGEASYEFPAGDFAFIGGFEPACGEFQSCSLFSPVFEFGAQDVARATAEAVLAALFDPAVRESGRAPEHNPIPAPAVSRRDVLRGRWGDSR